MLCGEATLQACAPALTLIAFEGVALCMLADAMRVLPASPSGEQAVEAPKHSLSCSGSLPASTQRPTLRDASFRFPPVLPPPHQVLQLPIVKNRLKKLLSTAVKKIAMHGQPIIPSSEDTLEEFLQVRGGIGGGRDALLQGSGGGTRMTNVRTWCPHQHPLQ